MLSNEKKHLFLNLEIYMAKVDGEFSEDERQIIDTHCLEMHIDNNNYETDMSQDDVIKQLQNSLTHEEQKMVFLELIATIMADDIYHEKEKNLTNKLADVFDIQVLCRDLQSRSNSRL